MSELICSARYQEGSAFWRMCAVLTCVAYLLQAVHLTDIQMCQFPKMSCLVL